MTQFIMYCPLCSKDTTLISRMEFSASTIIAVSPLPLREDVPPKEVSVAAVRAEAARDP